MSTYDNFSSHLGGPGGLNQLADLEHLVFKQKVGLIDNCDMHKLKLRRLS